MNTEFHEQDREQNTDNSVFDWNSIPESPAISEQNTSTTVWSIVNRFLNLTGGSLFYCLSAMSVLYGIAKIIDPVFANSTILHERINCIGVLNLYELLVVGALFLIVKWRNVKEDAVSLVLLAPILMTANAAALDQITLDAPWIAATIAVACIILAFIKVVMMRRFLNIHIDGALMAGVLILLAWNFGTGPLLSLVLVSSFNTSTALNTVWHAGWLISIIAGTLMWYHSLIRDTGASFKEHHDKAFLNTSAMAWVFALILLILTCVHQYMIAYVFDLEMSLSALLPAFALFCMIAIEIFRSYRARTGMPEPILAVLPTLVILVCIYAGIFSEIDHVMGLDLRWYPAAIMLFTAFVAVFRGFRTPAPIMLWPAMLSATATVLTVGIIPKDLGMLNWNATAATAILSLITVGIVLRREQLLLAGIVALAPTVCFLPVTHLATRIGISPFQLVGMSMGGGFVMAHLLFGSVRSRHFGIAGSLLLAGFMTGAFHAPLGQLMAGGTVLVLTSYAVFRTRPDILINTVLCIPMTTSGYIVSIQFPNWRFVAFGFVLLVLGTIVSIRKNELLRLIPE